MGSWLKPGASLGSGSEAGTQAGRPWEAEAPVVSSPGPAAVAAGEPGSRHQGLAASAGHAPAARTQRLSPPHPSSHLFQSPDSQPVLASRPPQPLSAPRIPAPTANPALRPESHPASQPVLLTSGPSPCLTCSHRHLSPFYSSAPPFFIPSNQTTHPPSTPLPPTPPPPWPRSPND